MKHSEKHSGYTAGINQWKEFLSCWVAQEKQLILSKAADSTNETNTSLLASTIPINDKKIAAVRKLEIAKLEQRLNVRLPASYVDFLMVMRHPAQSKHRNSDKSDVGFFDLADVDYVKNYAPDWLARTTKAFEGIKLPARNVNPVFGTEQNDDIYKFAHDLPSAIVIGKHHPEEYALILLYPQNKTSDGEMEATLRGWSEEFQAPSFSELMRQISYFATVPQSVQLPFYSPPYPQDKLMGSCADKLHLTNVWWK